MSNKKNLLVASVFLVGCAPLQPLGAAKATLVLSPQVVSGRLTQGEVTPYTKASIQHLGLELRLLGSGALVATADILKAELDFPVTFRNLVANKGYRVKAIAYASPGTSLPISLDDANSWTDITVLADDRPTLTSLKVRLVDKPFNGQATGSLAIIPGGYIPSGPEQFDFSYYLVTTFAGSGTSGFAEGVGTGMKFNGVYGLAVDAQGVVYFGDFTNQRIREISPGGVSSTLAGGGAGFENGTGTAAKFGGPYGVTVDAQGYVYVGDRDNHCVRKVSPTGVVSTLAGNGTAGLLDGTGTLAQMNAPRGVTVDAQGNVYVADRDNHAVRKITPTGVVSTIGGDGTSGYLDGSSSSSRFFTPMGVAVDPQDNVYVADTGNNRIRKITPGGIVTTIAGNGSAAFTDGLGTLAGISAPIGIASDVMGNLYIGEYGNSCVRRIRPSGMVTTLAGAASGYADGTGTLALFNHPRGVALDAGGNLYVADSDNHRIRKLY